jgi:MYXO-CTERM domain-containing protein
VYRYVQLGNPGGYHPIPQGPEPFDSRGDAPKGPPVKLAAFERDLEVAVANVERFRAIVATKEAGRIAELSQLLPPLEDELGLATRGGRRIAFDDDFDGAVVKQIVLLARPDDVPTALDAMARAHLVMSVVRELPIAKVAQIAADPSAPVHRRVMAARVIRERESGDVPLTHSRALPALLKAKERAVRVAGADALATLPRDVSELPLLEAWKTEADPWARIAILRASHRLAFAVGLEPPLAEDALVVAAIVRAGSVRIQWAARAEAARTLASVTVRGTPFAGVGAPFEQSLDVDPGGYSADKFQLASARAFFDPKKAPPAGRYRLEITAAFTSKEHADVLIPDVTIEPAKWPPRAAAEPPAPASASARAQPAPSGAAQTETRGGCGPKGCAIGAEHGAGGAAALALAALAALALRRRSRRGLHQ